MCLWVYTGSISHWGVWDIWRISTPKNICLQLKRLVWSWRNESWGICDEIDIPYEDTDIEKSGGSWRKSLWRIEAWRFTLSVLLSSHSSNRNTVLLKGVEVTHWNEFPHDAQPKPNPTKSLKWGIWVTWGLSQLRVPTISIATPHHWSYPHQRSY